MMLAMSAAHTILVPLAEGFEELEAVAIVDVLRRAGVEVIVAGLAPGPVRGAHGLTLETDAELDEVDADAITGIVLPGGMPGTTNLAADPRVLALLRATHADGRTTAAICAAPLVLAAAGVESGHDVTSHPSVRTKLGTATVLDAPRVVRSRHVTTSQGPGTALEFALDLVEQLVGPQQAAELSAAMLVRR